MKISLLVGVIMCVLSLCSPNNSQPINSQNQTSQNNFPYKKGQDACEILNIDDLISLLDWNKSNIRPAEPYKINDRNTMCTISHGEENLSIVVYMPSQKGKDNNVLEKKYGALLSNGEDGYRYEDLSTNKDKTILMGTNDTGQHGIYYYSIRKRWGSEGHVILELSGPNSEKTKAKSKLIALLDQLR